MHRSRPEASKSEFAQGLSERRCSEILVRPCGRDHLDLGRFSEAGVEVTFFDYFHPNYRQLGKVSNLI